MLRVLHFHHPPRVQAPPDLLPLGLDLLVGPDHGERDAGLNERSSISCCRRTASRAAEKQRETHLEDSGLLFKIFVLVGLGVRKVVDLDAVVVNLVQDLKRGNKTP